jgi:hypothetical protein
MLQLTRPSVAALPQDLAAERQSLRDPANSCGTSRHDEGSRFSHRESRADGGDSGAERRRS